MQCSGSTKAGKRRKTVEFTSEESEESDPNIVLSSKAAFIARLGNTGIMKDLAQLPRPRVLCVHHLKFAVANLDVSIAWYERVLGAQRVPSLDHVQADRRRFAAVLKMGDWSDLFLELRHSETQAAKDRGWDPITLSVQGKEDLELWIDWLAQWGTTHSPLLTGVRGWTLVFEVSVSLTS